jgi:N-acetyl sugar amidotransferase
MSVTWCKRCVYPSSSAISITFDDEGVCSGCRVAEQNVPDAEIDWEERKLLLKETILENRKRDDYYDCIIGVSGGKDSYYQAHVIKNELGLNPLLVTYYGNNYLPEGEYNLHRMADVFDADHLIYKPGVDKLRKLNRLGFKMMGDMNWHNHCGIYTVPVRTAVRYDIPVVLYGEHGRTNIGGMFNLDDMVELTARYVREHVCRGFTWENMAAQNEGLGRKDLDFTIYPNDDELDELGFRGIYMGFYLLWKPNDHAEMVQKEYGWKASDQPFERTYRRISNLDDMHENGVHDYLKYVKFGYGRCTDHASKDVRDVGMPREEAVELVRKHDHIKSKDLYRWLEYVGMNEEDFDKIADSFRDARVWWKDQSDSWCKHNIWDDEETRARKETERLRATNRS